MNKAYCPRCGHLLTVETEIDYYNAEVVDDVIARFIRNRRVKNENVQRKNERN